MRAIHSFRHWLLPLVSLPLLGCGSRTSDTYVTGIVALDGQPLPAATVIFEPLEQGRPATGYTDGSGRFQLVVDHNHTGIPAGKYRVRIRTWEPGFDDGQWHPDTPERVPTIYNDLSEQTPQMLQEISGQSQSVEFQLTSSAGQIAQRQSPAPAPPH
ncbi:MAG: carboxypeptidase-like regulatory domain-containing protein [Planctomycetaceae bacterium]